MRLIPEIHAEVERLADEWDDLADRAHASPFMRPGWVAAWRRAFGQGRLEIVALRHANGSLAAVAPMERRAGRLRALVNWHTPHWYPIADGAEALSAVSRLLVTRARPWLSAHFMDSAGDGFAALDAAAKEAACRTRVYTLERSPVIHVTGSWEDYEQMRLSGKRRANLRRLWRRLEERGSVSVDVVDESSPELLEEGFAVEESGWKGGGGTAIVSEPATRAFYTEVAQWAASRGWLQLAYLRLDGRALAFDFSVEAGGVHYLLKTGFIHEERSAAPGVLLRRHMLRKAFQDGLLLYDFLGDAVDWKAEWTDDRRELVAHEAFSPTPAGAAGWLTWRYGYPALRLALARVR